MNFWKTKSQVYKKTCSSRHIRKEEKNFSSQEKCWSADKPDCIWKCLNWSISIGLSLNQDLFWIETHLKLNWHCRLQTVSRYLWSSTNLVIPFKYFIYFLFMPNVPIKIPSPLSPWSIFHLKKFSFHGSTLPIVIIHSGTRDHAVKALPFFNGKSLTQDTAEKK